MSTMAPARRPGFTLIEILIVIVILGTLLALLIPAVMSARQAAQRAGCANNLRQIGLAVLNYESQNTIFPPAHFGRASLGNESPFPADFSVFVRLLAQMEQQPLFDAVNFSQTSWDGANLTVAGVGVASLMCPSDSNASRPVDYFLPPLAQAATPQPPPDHWPQQLTSYAAVVGILDLSAGMMNDGLVPGTTDRVRSAFDQFMKVHTGVIIPMGSTRLADISDGTSHTLLLTEKASPPNSLVDFPNRWNCGDTLNTLTYTLLPPSPANRPKIALAQASSPHPGGLNSVLADGSVRFISNTVDSWTPLGQSYFANYRATLVSTKPFQCLAEVAPGVQLGIWQALATRAGGEILDDARY